MTEPNSNHFEPDFYARFQNDSSRLKVYKLQGNFLLIRIFQDEQFENLITALCKASIKVLNTAFAPLLKNTFRGSIGTVEENEAFLQCMLKTMGLVLPVPSNWQFSSKKKAVVS